MLPDIWLTNERLRKLRTSKFPSQPKSAFIQLAESMFGKTDLNKVEIASLVKRLSESTGWPTRQTATEEDESLVGDLDHTEATPEWLLMGLGMLVNIQPGTSVLDLFCGTGAFAATIPQLSRCYYEGYDNNADLLVQGRRVFGDKVQLHHENLCRWIEQEPETQYGLVFAHLPFGLVFQTEHPCLENQTGGQINVEAAFFEIATKVCTKGGIIAIVTESNQAGLNRELANFLDARGTILTDITKPPYHITIFRNGIRARAGGTVVGTCASEDEFMAFCAEQTSIRTPVSSEDPRPMVIKTWDIELAPNGKGHMDPIYGRRRQGQPDAELFLTKNGVAVRWSEPRIALEWASHQALSASLEESWGKTQLRFNRRFGMDTYLDIRQSSSPNSILNLPDAYTVGEEPALAKHMLRRTRKHAMLELPYPEKSTLDNRYYTLGPGCTLVRGEEDWKVMFSEPDFSNSKPPKVHIERM